MKTPSCGPFLTILIFSIAACGGPSSIEETEVLETDIFLVRDIDPGSMTPGRNLLKAVVGNRTAEIRHLVVDFRTEGLGLGRSNWQRQFCFTLEPGKSRDIEMEYEITAPLLDRMILRFGESDEFFDIEEFIAASREGRAVCPLPRTTFLAHKIIHPENIAAETAAFTAAADSRTILLHDLSPDALSRLKSGLPGAVRQSRSGTNGARAELRDLLLIDRPVSGEFDYRTEADESDNLAAYFERNGMTAEIFSIAGEEGQRIRAFFAAPAGDSSGDRPLIVLLSGNPPGTRESLAGQAVLFGRLGYAVAGIDRRPSARILDAKDKFLANYADPVFDLLRLLDYFASEPGYRISRIGLYGFSAGAREGLFAAALDHRIDAAVLAAGISSHDRLFLNKGWFPTFSGMIIFPELGLGRPDIGKLTETEFWENFNKLEPKHNLRAREIFAEVFPFFDKLDLLHVGPLAAPVPLMIVTGARDGQFLVSGAADVDRAMEEVYRNIGYDAGLEFVVQPRSGHTVDIEATYLAAAFFKRWLQ